MFSSVPGLYPLDACSNPPMPCWWPKMSPGFSKYPPSKQTCPVCESVIQGPSTWYLCHCFHKHDAAWVPANSNSELHDAFCKAVGTTLGHQIDWFIQSLTYWSSSDHKQNESQNESLSLGDRVLESYCSVVINASLLIRHINLLLTFQLCIQPIFTAHWGFIKHCAVEQRFQEEGSCATCP